MDATETDSDVLLYKHATDFVKHLDHGITTHIKKSDGRGGVRLRPWVRYAEVMKHTCSVLDYFQELPQLLDPHLSRWIPLLAETYLDYLQSRHRYKRVENKSNLLAPLDLVICKILYSFCKVRGEKVIVRFLNVETKYLELLLSAVEEAEQDEVWSWEQRYIALLWLSHLLLAPFDLSTISSADLEEGVLPHVPAFKWPHHVPGIAMRVVPLAIKYLARPGKERDAAKALLVRVAMRRDMQEIGILDALVRWSLASLRPTKDEAHQSPYFFLGLLSFLAGLLRSASETSDLDAYLPSIFNVVLAISEGVDPTSKAIMSLALARKMMLKIIRSLVVSILRSPRQDMRSTELTENAIGYLLDSLSDNDTPVRLSASKSLSIIALKLDPRMASQVVDAVLEALNRNLLWSKAPRKLDGAAEPVRDLSAVNPLEWHGLMLTLSHLLYRRSPPANQLSDIVHALLLGLSFEQRGVSGASIGSNVRDAACFGIWALARRYATQELLALPTTSAFAAKSSRPSSSILQVLGTELVMTASLDPEGNIRRGASAALQELIGRHPDTVEHGIGVVQAVDYHAVARRARAVQQVAVSATRLSGQYGEAVVDGILSWRGIGDLDTASRRVAGAAFGDLTALLSGLPGGDPFSRFESSVDLVLARLDGLQKRQIEERHGLLLCFAGLVDKLSELLQQETKPVVQTLVVKILNHISAMLEDCLTNEYRRPELIAEAVSRLVVSALPLIQAVAGHPISARGREIFSPDRGDEYARVASAFESVQVTPEVRGLAEKLKAALPSWLSRSEAETMESASAAGLMLLVLSGRERTKIIEEWATIVASKTSGLANAANGYFHVLALAQPLVREDEEKDIVCKAFLDRWDADKNIEIRVAILQSLTRGRILRDKPGVFLNLLADGLDNYTTTARGDEGSLVRMQALKAVKLLWEDMHEGSEWAAASIQKLIYSALRLSAEKLDRVRREAKDVIALLLSGSDLEHFLACSHTSKNYFLTLLSLPSKSLHPHALTLAKSDETAWTAGLMAGYVSSADTGNEDLVMESRAALCEHEGLEGACAGLGRNIRTEREDRVVVPTLEVVAFMLHAGIFRCADWKGLCLAVQRAGYKTGNVRKLMACVKVYGGIAAVTAGVGVGVDSGLGSAGGGRIGGEGGVGGEGGRAGEGGKEARKRLGALMLHPWPRVRSAVVDELWGLFGIGDGGGEADGHGLTGVNWAGAPQSQVRELIGALKLT